MKKIFQGVVLAFLLLAGIAWAGTLTTSGLLYKPADREKNYTTLLNANWDVVDGRIRYTIVDTTYHNIVFGEGAGAALTTGTNNVMFGYLAGAATTTGVYNNFIGSDSGKANITGSYNTFLGANTGPLNTGSNNSFIGYSAGAANTSGYQNTFIGIQAGASNTTGYTNYFSGYQAGFSNTTGYANTFIGDRAGYANQTGYHSLFIGSQAGTKTTTGAGNVFIGDETGYENTTGQLNTFVGLTAGNQNTTGSNNVMIGNNTGEYSATGSYNTIVGNSAGAAANTNYGVFLGYKAGRYETGASKLFIDSSTDGRTDEATARTNSLIYGDFAAPQLTVNGTLNANGAHPGPIKTNGHMVPFIACQSAVAATVANTTTRTTLGTCVIPANAMGPNGALRVTSEWTTSNSADMKTLALYFGGTRMAYRGISTSSYNRDVTMIRNVNSANSQKAYGGMTLLTTTSAGTQYATIDTTAAANLTFEPTDILQAAIAQTALTGNSTTCTATVASGAYATNTYIYVTGTTCDVGTTGNVGTSSSSAVKATNISATQYSYPCNCACVEVGTCTPGTGQAFSTITLDGYTVEVLPGN